MIITLIATAVATVPTLSAEDALASIKEKAEAYQARPTCGFTASLHVDSEDNEGPINEDVVLQYDRAAEDWVVLKEPESGLRGESARRPVPQDWYHRALQIAATAERAEVQDDGSFVLYTENIAKGTLVTNGRDGSKRSRAQTTVALVDGNLQITGYSVSLKQPFRIPLFARIRDVSDDVTFAMADDHGPLASFRATVWDISYTGKEERGSAKIYYSDYDCPA